MGATATLTFYPGSITYFGAEGVDPYKGLHDGRWFIREAERQAARANRRAAVFVMLACALVVATYFAL